MRRLLRKANDLRRERGLSALADSALSRALPGNTYREKRADLEYRLRSPPKVSRGSDCPTHVVLIVVDAMRLDFINEEDSPFFTTLEKTSAITAAPWTYPSVSSLVTGLYPHEHGAIRQNDDPDNVDDDELRLPPKLPTNIPTLPEFFAAAGYDTYGAFGFNMPFLALSGRFENHRLYSDPDASLIFRDYVQWLQKESTGDTFSYLHLSDLHEPISPPSEYWEQYKIDDSIDSIRGWGKYTDALEGEGAQRFREQKIRLYRSAVNYVDEQVRSLSYRLEQELDSPPVLIVTSDHGEGFWEHAELDKTHFYDSRPAYGVGHGGTPYESIARVPILSNTVDFGTNQVSTIDITPTLLNIADITPKKSVSGVSRSGKESPDRVLITESARYGYEKKAAYTDEYKLICSYGDGVTLEFSLPEEELVHVPAEIRNKLMSKLPPWPDSGSTRTVSPSVQSQLEDLGYK